MRVRELDEIGDWTFGRGQANYLDKSEAIAQCVKTKLRALKGNWIINQNDGIAWFNYLDKNPDTRQLEIDIKAELQKIEGITEVNEFDILLDSETRRFLIQISYTDIYGQEKEVSFNASNNR